jgi:hypothetical protein
MRGEITYSTDKHIPANLVTITGRRAFAIIEMNKRGERPESLQADGQREVKRSVDLLEQENINRFDNMQRGGKKRRKGGRPDQRRGNERRENKNNPPKAD